MAVVCHELATNATKYGALSVGDGHVAVVWTLTADGRLVLSWTETDGPPVAVPTREGFGTRILKSIISRSLKGDMRLDWREGGLVCEFALPI